ncbi:MAG: CNNM domain-containing protein [Candidatus Fermentibacteria bacterium]
MIPLLFLLAVILATFSSGAETAFSAASRIRALSRLREGRKWARLSLGFIENPRRYLTTTLVGTNIGIVLASMITSRFAEGTGITWLEPVLIVFLSFFMLIFAEMIPKQLMLVSREAVVSNLSLPLLLLRTLLFPVILIADFLSSLIVGRRVDSRVFESKSEILGLLADSSSDTGPIAERILRMNDIRIGNVMRKLKEIPVTRIGESRNSILEKLIDSGHSFVLVNERDNETVRGYTDGNSLLKSGDLLDGNGIEGIPYFEEGDDLISVTTMLRKSAAPAGIVLGRTGQPAGIAILDDIIDSLLGKTGTASVLKVPSDRQIEWQDGRSVIR